MKDKIYIIGAGGHAYSCIDVILNIGFEIKGIYALEKDLGKDLLGHKVIGTQYELSNFIKKKDNLHIAVGHTFEKNERSKIYDLFVNKCKFPTIISPHSFVSTYSVIDYGSIIMPGVKIAAGSKIGMHSIINTNSVIDHNAHVGDFCHVSTSVTINGNVKIGNNVFIGSGSVLKESISVSSNNSFKMCSRIVKDK